MGDKSLNIALAHAALAGTSAFAFFQCSDMKYARVAFGLYCVNGIVGVVDYVLPKHNEHVKKALAGIARITRPCYLPLIAAEAFVYAGFEEKWGLCHCIFPVVYIILTEFCKKNVKTELLDLSTICNAVSICFSAYTKEDPYGGVTALLGVGAFLGFDYNSLGYLLMIGVTNLGAVQFFKQFFI